MTEQELKSTRVNIDGLFKAINELPKSREISLAYTKCQESKMWLGKALQAMEVANPYPESKDPSSGNYIAPTADTREGFFFTGTIVEQIKGMRMFVDELAAVIKWNKNYNDGYSEWKKDEDIILAVRASNQYIVECGMWLGMELGRIRDVESERPRGVLPTSNFNSFAVIQPGRGSGNTTRIIDTSIQKLFTDGYVVLVDHHGSPEATKFLIDRFQKRMRNEHGHINITVNKEGNNWIAKKRD